MLFPQWADSNLGNMTKIGWTKVGNFDFLFYSNGNWDGVLFNLFRKMFVGD